MRWRELVRLMVIEEEDGFSADSVISKIEQTPRTEARDAAVEVGNEIWAALHTDMCGDQEYYVVAVGVLLRTLEGGR